MASKKRTEKDLKATVKKLQSKLDKAEASAERWKTKAARQKKAAAASDAQVKKLTKRLAKTAKSSKPAAAAPPASAEPVETSGATPDASWTVVQLRAEARERGLTGLSGKSKAELLAALG
jgi:hypothetical protein